MENLNKDLERKNAEGDDEATINKKGGGGRQTKLNLGKSKQ